MKKLNSSESNHVDGDQHSPRIYFDAGAFLVVNVRVNLVDPVRNCSKFNRTNASSATQLKWAYVQTKGFLSIFPPPTHAHANIDFMNIFAIASGPKSTWPTMVMIVMLISQQLSVLNLTDAWFFSD